jgi:AcrR family transcriptional regulator
MTDEKRPYRMKRRAELEEATRLRITESAMELHGTVGPARTTVSAVADRAGVRRSTVYRHFHDEATLFAACSSHWMALNPPPDLGTWAAIADPDARLRTALTDLYGYYRRTEEMMEKLLRDAPLVPIIGQLMGAYGAFLGAARDVLMAGRRNRGRARERLIAATGHALSFTTWRSLAREQGLDDARAVDLMCRLVSAAST